MRGGGPGESRGGPDSRSALAPQGGHDTDRGTVPVPAPRLGPVRSPAARRAQPLTRAPPSSPRRRVWRKQALPPGPPSGHGDPLSERVQSQDADQHGPRPDSSASSSSPKWTPGATPSSLSFRTGAGISADLRGPGCPELRPLHVRCSGLCCHRGRTVRVLDTVPAAPPSWAGQSEPTPGQTPGWEKSGHDLGQVVNIQAVTASYVDAQTPPNPHTCLRSRLQKWPGGQSLFKGDVGTQQRPEGCLAIRPSCFPGRPGTSSSLCDLRRHPRHLGSTKGRQDDKEPPQSR